MSRIYVHGVGAVSCAGWGMNSFREMLEGGRQPEPAKVLRPDGTGLNVLRVPAPANRAAWSVHPRLRRSSPISHYAVAAALEALGTEGRVVEKPGLGVIVSVMGGSVQYSRRFFAEALADPATASPLLFPETVFNAPASHLGALLSTGARNDTLVADQTGFPTALAAAADWLDRGEVETCLVVGAEEYDWITAEAAYRFSKRIIPSEGAAAVLLSRAPGSVELTAVSSPEPYVRSSAAKKIAAMCSKPETPVDSLVFTHGNGASNNTGHAVDQKLGDGLGAAGGWVCVAAIDALMRNRGNRAVARVRGSNLQTQEAVFSRVAT